MEHFNSKFDDIMSIKMKYIIDKLSDSESTSNTKIKKMTNLNVDDIDYTAKQTLSKIAAEQERKYKSSKAYKNAQDYKTI